MIIEFGKFRGKRLEEIPVDYLCWVHKNCVKAPPKLRAEIRRILSTEAESRVHQQGALCAPGLVAAWYRQLSREFHPDCGGSHDAMVAINRARDLLLRAMEDSAA